MTSLSDKTEENSTENKFNQEEHYFKVDRKILNIASVKDLGKAELLLYLQHCRAINPKKHLGCSLVGKKNTAKLNLGLDPAKIEKTQKLLIDKFLLRERPDVKNGFLKSIPVEVLAFPDYTPPQDKKSEGAFKPNCINENQHRTYEKGTYINLPSALIDSGILKDLRRQSIFALMWLYDNISWLDYWGINPYLVHKKAYNNKGYTRKGRFGEGFRQSIYKKSYYIADKPENVFLSKDLKFIQGNLKDSVEEVIDKELFYSKPVLIEEDLDDSEIIRFIKEIHKGIIPFDSQDKNPEYLFSAADKNNQKVIWIISPSDKFIIKTPDYEEFYKNRQENLSRQKDFYSYDDFKTRNSKHLELINTEEFWEWHCENYPETYKSICEYFDDCRPHAIKFYDGDMDDEIAFWIYCDETRFDNPAEDENFLIHTILPNIPIGQIMHYNNYIKRSE